MTKGITKVRSNAGLLRKKWVKSLRTRTRMVRMEARGGKVGAGGRLLAKGATGEMEEEGFERGALTREDMGGDRVGLGKGVKTREEVVGVRTETVKVRL